jgi:hypothetical protein
MRTWRLDTTPTRQRRAMPHLLEERQALGHKLEQGQVELGGGNELGGYKFERFHGDGGTNWRCGHGWTLSGG